MINKDFYPTPASLISRMWRKVDRNRVSNILEPSAGKGDILDYIKSIYEYNGCAPKVSAIELDDDLRAALVGKKYRVIDSDFLAYSGLDKFDLIIGNPPFDHGDIHLLKAINMLYSGQIVFLLNAETLKNPCTNTRKELVQKLDELKADIEYIPRAFADAERKTMVEVALVYISIERDVEVELFGGCTDKAQDETLDADFEAKDIASRNTVEFMVESFDAAVKVGTEVILSYFKAKRLVGEVMTLKVKDERDAYGDPNLNETFNAFLAKLRKEYWKTVLDIPEVKKRMTTKEVQEFHRRIEIQSDMDFTERNIRAFIVDLLGKYDQILNRAVAELFDTFTMKFNYHDECAKNIHYFNGWKTNKAFYVNKKVIVPWRQMIGGYNNGVTCGGSLDFGLRRALDDIDMVMNYFTLESDFVSLADASEQAMKTGQTSKIESSHFIITFYLKGTMHLTFRNPDTLRRFNIVACKEKHFLPEDYGRKKYTDMTNDEKSVVKEFEGEESYSRNIGLIGFTKETLAIGDVSA